METHAVAATRIAHPVSPVEAHAERRQRASRPAGSPGVKVKSPVSLMGLAERGKPGPVWMLVWL